jgi:transketolase
MKVKATRDAYGEALLELGREKEDVVVLDADCSESTRTKKFGEEFPERFFNVGVAEQDLIGTAAGLAISGKIAYASTFAIFTCRAWEQIRNTVAYDQLSVKIVATHSGLSDGVDGVSHQSLEDVSIMRSIPGISVFVPSDATQTKFVIKGISNHPGPAYVRLGRGPVPVLYDDDSQLGLFSANVLKEGKDVSIISCGVMVHEAIRAEKILSSNGIDAEIIDMHAIKPIDEETVIRTARKTGAVVTAEEHSIIGGLGSAIAEILSEKYPVPVGKVGIRDIFGESGSHSDLLKKYGLTAEDIVKAVRILK